MRFYEFVCNALIDLGYGVCTAYVYLWRSAIFLKTLLLTGSPRKAYRLCLANTRRGRSSNGLFAGTNSAIDTGAWLTLDDRWGAEGGKL